MASCGLMPRGQGALKSAAARARCIERCDFAVASAQEAVVHIIPVKVVSQDRPVRDDPETDSALAGAGVRARNVEGDNCPALSIRGKAEAQRAQNQAERHL